MALLALQLLGVVGSGWELLHGVGGGKAAELRRLNRPVLRTRHSDREDYQSRRNRDL